MKKRWLIRVTGLAAGIAVFAAACGQALDDSTPRPEGTGLVPPGVQEPAGSGDRLVVPNPTIDHHGDTVIIDNPDLGTIVVGDPGIAPTPTPHLSGPKHNRIEDSSVIGDEPAVGPTPPPITIIDGMDPNACNLVHSINGCFVDGRPAADIPLDEYLGLFAAAHEEVVMRSGAEPGSIRLAKIGRVEWPDASLGNPQPDLSYAQVTTPGFKMLLSSGKQTFLYHTSLDRVVLAEVTDTIDVPPLPLPPSLPPIEEPSSQGNNNSVGTQTTVTILEEIDPDKCNLEHNLTACTDEELDQMGVPGDPPVPTVAP